MIENLEPVTRNDEKYGRLLDLMEQLSEKMESINKPAAYVLNVLAASMMVGAEAELMKFVQPFKETLLTKLEQMPLPKSGEIH